MSWIEQIYYLGSWRTLDARGVRVSLYPPTQQTMTAGGDPSFPRAEFDALMERARPISVWLKWFVLVILACQVVVIARWVFFPGPGGVFAGQGSNIAFAVLLFAATLFGARSGLGARADRFCSEMLLAGRCAHCGYRLNDIAGAAPGTAVTCPECACAWHVKDAVPIALRIDRASERTME